MRRRSPGARSRSLSQFEFDLPFILFYALDPVTSSYRLAGNHGIAPGRAVTPHCIEPAATGPWPVAGALAGLRIAEIDDPSAILQR